MEKKSLWQCYNSEEFEQLEQVNALYRERLDEGKTERECARKTIALAKQKGYSDLREFVNQKKPLKAGDKVYATYADRAIVLFQIGKQPLECGMNMLGSHIDSPRIDLKQQTLYEEDGFAYFDTHYYGGVKNINGWRSRWLYTE